MKKIAFIGVGVMGKAMVQNLSQAGYPVSIYTRTKNKVEDLIVIKLYGTIQLLSVSKIKTLS